MQFLRQRRCCKHVFTEHGRYFYFKEKPDIVKIFHEFSSHTFNYQLPKRVKTSKMSLCHGIFLRVW